MKELILQWEKVNGRSYQIGIEKYANCYVNTDTFNVILECRGIDKDDFVDDFVDVRGIYTLAQVVAELNDTDNKDIIKIKDCIKLLETNKVQYITFQEEI